MDRGTGLGEADGALAEDLKAAQLVAGDEAPAGAARVGVARLVSGHPSGVEQHLSGLDELTETRKTKRLGDESDG